MKKVFLLLVLAVLIAGGAFAQRVGDTVQLGGQNYAVESVSGNRVTLLKVSLDGVWKERGGNVHTINGNNGFWTEIAPGMQRAVQNGYVKIGDLWLRNLRKTGDLTWTGEASFVSNNAPPAWFEATMTLSADGKTFRMLSNRSTFNFERM